jgi:hypothetical protein
VPSFFLLLKTGVLYGELDFYIKLHARFSFMYLSWNSYFAHESGYGVHEIKLGALGTSCTLRSHLWCSGNWPTTGLAKMSRYP